MDIQTCSLEIDDEAWSIYDRWTREIANNIIAKSVEDSVIEVNDSVKIGDDAGFPFSLSNLAYWVVRRKDGTTIKYELKTATQLASQAGKPVTALTPVKTYGGGSYVGGVQQPERSQGQVGGRTWDFCNHDPKDDPIFTSEDGKIKLWIADAPGVRKYKGRFDLVIDCGDVLSTFTMEKDGILSGDKELVELLLPSVEDGFRVPRLLKIDWADRKAPVLKPDFWLNLAAILPENTVINCQGGHGRSGTALVCLMMALNPEYTPMDAILHLRAIHCARAIESKDQHAYIDEVGKSLGRVANASKLTGVTSYREEFLKLKLKSATPYQERVRAGAGATKEKSREQDYEDAYQGCYM